MKYISCHELHELTLMKEIRVNLCNSWLTYATGVKSLAVFVASSS